MKFTAIIILVLALFPTVLQALPVDRPDAEIAAEARLTRDGQYGQFSIISCIYIVAGQNQTLLAYAFELHPSGYIITSADTSLPPIIAYSYTNDCVIDGMTESILLEMVRTDLEFRLAFLGDTPPELLGLHAAWWREYLSGEYELLSNLPDQQWPPAGTTPTEGWLMENWSQSAPYNDYCPLDLIAGSRSVAGCPAVAMGAIVNFGETTKGTQFDDTDDYYHNYHEYYWIDDDYIAHDFPSWPELNVLLDTLESHYATGEPLTHSDKAAMVYSCGAACKQVYTASISGTFGVDQVYDAYLRFGFTDCSLLDATSDSLYERLSANMMNAMPAHLAIIDSVSHYGHNMVIDGYNTEEFYHINFGWSGSYNGWYQFPLTGMPYGMNIIEGIVLDIGEAQQSIEQGPMQNTNSILQLVCLNNPVADYLSFDLILTETSNMNLSVYSISGQLIDTIAEGEFHPGSYSSEWITADVQCGVYHLVATGSFGIETIRFTVLR